MTARKGSFERPDETRSFPNGEASILHFDGASLGLGRLRPGWSFESSMKQITGTDSCPIRHVGYAISGRLHVRMDDGAELHVGPGEGYFIPPGHQAAVVGDEDFVGLEFDAGAIATFGKPVR
jgi:hypothetical protein